MRSIIPSESARSILWSPPSCLDDDGRKALRRHSNQIPEQHRPAPLDAMKLSLSFELPLLPQLLAQPDEADSVQALLSAVSFHCRYQKLPENGDNWNIHRSEQLQTISSLLNTKPPWTMLKQTFSQRPFWREMVGLTRAFPVIQHEVFFRSSQNGQGAALVSVRSLKKASPN